MALVGRNADAAALGGNIADFCAAVIDGHGGAGGVARRHAADVALVEQGACADGHGGAGFNVSRRALLGIVDAHAGAGFNIAHRVRVLDGGGADGDRGAGLDKLSLAGRHAARRDAAHIDRKPRIHAADGAGVGVVVPHSFIGAVALADDDIARLGGHAADLGALRVAVNGHAACRRKVAQHALVAFLVSGRPRLLGDVLFAHRNGAGRGHVADFGVRPHVVNGQGPGAGMVDRPDDSVVDKHGGGCGEGQHAVRTEADAGIDRHVPGGIGVARHSGIYRGADRRSHVPCLHRIGKQQGGVVFAARKGDGDRFRKGSQIHRVLCRRGGRGGHGHRLELLAAHLEINRLIGHGNHGGLTGEGNLHRVLLAVFADAAGDAQRTGHRDVPGVLTAARGGAGQGQKAAALLLNLSGHGSTVVGDAHCSGAALVDHVAKHRAGEVRTLAVDQRKVSGARRNALAGGAQGAAVVDGHTACARDAAADLSGEIGAAIAHIDVASGRDVARDGAGKALV